MTGDDGADIQPDRFLPFAERYGLMPQIDRWVFDEVLRTILQRPTLRVFANLSAASLNDEALLSYIEGRIRATGLTPGRLSRELGVEHGQGFHWGQPALDAIDAHLVEVA